MNKGISVLLINLALVITATAAPNPQSQSIKHNITTFVGTQFGSSTLCPLPPALPFQNTNLADWSLDSLSMLLLQWNHDGLCTNGGNFNADYAALLSDLQNFLATQHLDPTALQDLKSWISQLPVDANTISEFENWLQTLGTYCNDTVGVETESSKSVGTNLSLADQSVTAVPEPSTISTFILGIGLLGGVLLRLRPAR